MMTDFKEAFQLLLGAGVGQKLTRDQFYFIAGVLTRLEHELESLQVVIDDAYDLVLEREALDREMLNVLRRGQSDDT